ncbi:hypothetical protein HPB49_011019 [Dermacentor silvarum]|uniref:Uncharacterized protein n=1 Tax=Dermacentor silvarum TaxID=543639 RepID=A0ACB8C8S3_DERSI|nr:hypothetical protein HPB49_011019 [Dermacentor silvarum]
MRYSLSRQCPPGSSFLRTVRPPEHDPPARTLHYRKHTHHSGVVPLALQYNRTQRRGHQWPYSGNYSVATVHLCEAPLQVCQAGFRGVKTLNRIQSIVFDTVYNTNENLLICAPTGAGKTNVAMLAILHEVKQHITGRTLNANFKVVYVAPMKALAAEMVRNFGKRLESLGVVVRELTGDMQLSKAEIMKTHMLVTTPEKWDVVTRKSTGDIALNQIVKLLILDEVHLLHGDRGPVLEALVARTLRQVESSQTMIRIVGLSATLPNYEDVAHFLRVNPRQGLFYFDNRFRPVPLGQTFVGVKATSPLQQLTDMDEVCFEKVYSVVQKGYQASTVWAEHRQCMKQRWLL